MEFIDFKKFMTSHMEEMFSDTSVLFKTDVSKDEMWETYLESFPPKTNEKFRERREFDCNCCKSFIRAFGNVVMIKDNILVSIWDFDAHDPDKFDVVVHTMARLVKSRPIRDVFVTHDKHFGTKRNRQILEDGSVHIWNHFSADLPKKLVSTSSKSDESEIGNYRETKGVFVRSLNEISAASLDVFFDLVGQNGLYKGEEWKGALTKFKELHTDYHKLPEGKKDNFCWEHAVKEGPVVGKIKNHSIGTFLANITSGMPLEIAVRKYEEIVAGPNYKRPKPVYTKAMTDRFQKMIEEMGYKNSLYRRFSTIDDIPIKNVLFANRDVKRDKSGNIFDMLREKVPQSIKGFARNTEVTIGDFIQNVLPTTESMEVLFEGRLQPNLVSMISPVYLDAPSILKWGNNLTWVYNGDMADSMKQRVKAAGGNIDVDFRYSIQWNTGQWNKNDLDAHCLQPGRPLIYYSHMKDRQTGCELDVDIINPVKGVPSVENVVIPSMRKMIPGRYKVLVHCYSYRGGRDGFSAEIEFLGDLYQYDYTQPLKQGEKVVVAEFDFSLRDGIKFIKSLDSVQSSKEIWNIMTNQFHEVQVMMLSPNYWGENGTGVGNKHYMFMLKGCKNEIQPRGFFNEYLKEELMEHKRMFEALGGLMAVKPSDDQLSGLGFSSTQHNSLVVKVGGSFDRTLKVTF